MKLRKSLRKKKYWRRHLAQQKKEIQL